MMLRHVALSCGSEEQADNFYHHLLGLEKSAIKTLPAAVSKALFEIDADLKIINYRNDRLHFEIFLTGTQMSRPHRLAHVCLGVDDLAAFLTDCRRLQVKILQVPKGDKLLTFVSDDDGNLFEIQNFRTGASRVA